jgi:hypothetical protein
MRLRQGVDNVRCRLRVPETRFGLSKRVSGTHGLVDQRARHARKVLGKCSTRLKLATIREIHDAGLDDRWPSANGKWRMVSKAVEEVEAED